MTVPPPHDDADAFGFDIPGVPPFPPQPDPLLERDELRELPLHNTPEAFQFIVNSVCKDFSVPNTLVVPPYLATLSTAQGRSLIRIHDAYVEPGQLWCVAAAEAGSRKSPVLRAARQPLVEIQEELMREFAPENRTAQGHLQALEEEVKRVQKMLNEVVGGRQPAELDGDGDDGQPSAVNLQQAEAALRAAHERLEEFKEQMPTSPKMWFDDPTSEKLHDILAEHPHSGIVIPEGQKFFRKLIEGKLELAPLLSAFSMETTSRELVTREVRTAKEPSLTMLVMIQTAFLIDALRNEDMVSSGFLDRPFYTVSPRTPLAPIVPLGISQLRADGLHNSSEADRMWRRIIRWEVQRTTGTGFATRKFGIDDDAVELAFAYLQDNVSRVNAFTDNRTGLAAVTKSGGLAFRLAKVFAQMRLDPPDFDSPVETLPEKLDAERFYPIGARDIAAGFEFAEHSIAEIERLLGAAGDPSTEEDADLLAVLTVLRQFIEADEPFNFIVNARIITRRRSRLKAPAIERAFSSLVAGGWAYDVTAAVRNAKSRHLLIRPDIVRWICEYNYVPGRPPRRSPAA